MTFFNRTRIASRHNMTVTGKYLVYAVLILPLAFLSNVVWPQTSNSVDGDLLDFLPAIISAVTREPQVLPPPAPPVTGLGDFRTVKTEIFSLIEPAGRNSELVSSWDSSGNKVRDDLRVFNLSGGNPSDVFLTVVSNISFDGQSRPTASSYTTAYANGNQELGTKEYRYINGRLQSTVSQSTLTGSTVDSVTTNSEIVFKYSGVGRLLGATVTASQSQSSIVSTEQHTVGYDSSNRVNSHTVVKTSTISSTPEETLHTHRYDFEGNLVESVTIAPNNLKIVKTFGSIEGNKITSSVIVSDQASDALFSHSVIESTYEVGPCTRRGPNDPFVIEGNITASFPYSPNVGCIKR